MIDDLLVAKLRTLPEPERFALLDRECAGDPARRARVEGLLRGDVPSSITEAYTPNPGSKNDPTELLGAVIAGRYRLVEVIGEGGMGSVYRAEQSEPVKRFVALKLIKSGVDSAQVNDRFEAERQALAVMDHPGIARVFDGGATADGRPFFVMELVDGVSITRYCDVKRLGIKTRLELFVAVCQAVQHAHQKGVIHRDLKPANVLVTEVDGQPVPKVIDFGVAKATEQKLTDADIADLGLIIGTPAYMSPEQADPNATDIDTRTDVYALGIILYELLVGSPPIEIEEFKRGALLEMLRIVREVEPPKPSTKLSTAEAGPSIAANRNMEPAKLGKLLKGELDWVVLKALEKDRARRYQTANGFARDVRRYLDDEPVEARPPSAGYRLRKFVRRNRIAVIGATAVAAALVVGIVGFAWQAQVARTQRDRAVLAEEQTKKRADELKQVADYQAKMLKQIDPTEAGVRLMADLRIRHAAALEKAKAPDAEKVTRTSAFERELHQVNATDAAVALIERTLLAPAAKAIETQFGAQPLVDAALRHTLGQSYQSLGRRSEALTLYQRAYELRNESLGEDDLDTLRSRCGIGHMQGELQQLAEADRTARDTFSAFLRVFGPDHAETLHAHCLLATQLHLQGNYDECERIMRDVIERQRRTLGAEHADTLAAMSDLGQYLTKRGKYADAVKVLREVEHAQRRVADAYVATTLTNLGIVLIRVGEYAAAEACMREALERRRRDLGEDHPFTVSSMNNLAALLMDREKLTEAEPLAREALDKSRRVFGNEHSDTLKTINVVGQVLQRQGKFAETESYYREAYTTGRRVLGEDHPDAIIWTANLGSVLLRLGRIAEAEEYFHEALDKNRRRQGETHPDTLTMTYNLADCLRRQNKYREAEAVLRAAADAISRDDGETVKEANTVLRAVVEMMRQQNRLADAEAYTRVWVAKLRRTHGDDHADTLLQLGQLASVLRDQGKLDQAEPLYLQVMETTRRLHGPEHFSTVLAILRLASLRVAQKKHAEVLELLAPIDGKVRKAIPGPIGALREASMFGLRGKARAALAMSAVEFQAAENDLLAAQSTFEKSRGTKDRETREWTQALVDFYAARELAEPGKGYEAKAVEWSKKLKDN